MQGVMEVLFWGMGTAALLALVGMLGMDVGEWEKRKEMARIQREADEAERVSEVGFESGRERKGKVESS